jgi:hypothetical protein
MSYRILDAQVAYVDAKDGEKLSDFIRRLGDVVDEVNGQSEIFQVSHIFIEYEDSLGWNAELVVE